MKIGHTIIGPAHPGSWEPLRQKAEGLGFQADRMMMPWEILRESVGVRQAVLEAAETYLTLHEGEHVWVYARRGYGAVAGEMLEHLYEVGRARDIQVHPHLEFLDFEPTTPTHTLLACGDGRPWFWWSLSQLHRELGAPRVITPPGEAEWLKRHPEVRTDIDAWLHEQPKAPIVVAKHGGHPDEGGGCGYRRVVGGFAGSLADEFRVARKECDDPAVEYRWQPGFGPHASVLLRPREL